MLQSTLPQQSTLLDYVPELREIINSNSPPIIVFYRRVKSNTGEVSQREISSEEKRMAIANVLNEILSSSHVSKDFDDLRLTQNRKFWITSLLYSYPEIDVQHAQFLLNEFTDEMRSRMREEEKYGILLLAKDVLLLCHSKFGEFTITPNWEILPRMLDSDNVIRFIAFIKKQDGRIKVKYHEKYKTTFFVDWLRLPKKEAYSYLGGKYRIEGEINGIKMALELPHDELYKLLKGHIEGIKLRDGWIIFERPLEGIAIETIRAGKKPYKDLEEFIQDFTIEYFDIKRIQEKYWAILNSLDSIIARVIDDKEKIRAIFPGNTKAERTIPKEFDVILPIFATENKIEIKESFLRELAVKLLNGEKLRIFHPGDMFSADPVVIRSLEIYNNLILSEASKSILEIINQAESGGSLVDKLLIYSALKIIVAGNSDKKIAFFLERLSSKMLSFIRVPTLLLRKEDIVVEFKAREFFEGDNNEIATKVADDLNTKFTESPVKVYFFGVDEKAKRIDGINMGRLGSERMGTLEEKIKQKTNAKRIHLYPAPLPDEPRKGIIIMVAIK
ncbi:hypothetical protein [Palaeococcus pacificus]|nr:hypothetical protein [Palaeococcus pacificus]